MAVTDSDIIDAIGVEPETGCVVLSIADHLDWDEEGGHLLLLQEKLNTYLRFIEGGEMVEAYPDARGRPVRIDVVLRVEPDAEGATFLESARQTIEGAGIGFRARFLRSTGRL